MFQRTRNYAKDYERIGSTVRYRGKHYRFTIEQPAQKRCKVAYAVSLAVALGLFIAIGFSGSPALGAHGGAGGGATPLYVVLPYVLLLLPLGLGLARAALLVFKSRALEYAEYDKYLVQQKGVLLSALILDGALLISMITFLLIGSTEASAQWVAILETLLCGTCIFFSFRQYHALFTSVAIDEATSVRYDI
ncbi:MAG: hypothetical protein C0413_01340 [Clostridiales bacterium]|nr:hypothetical protein [Clostridiales bacterium]